VEKTKQRVERHYTPEQEKRLVSEMRTIINREQLNGTARIVFDSLFPANLKPEIFNTRSLAQKSEVRYTPEEKQVADECMHHFGYRSTKTGEVNEWTGVDSLRVGFTKDKTKYINRLNDLPFVKSQAGVGQTGSEAQQLKTKEAPFKTTRAQHSQHLANMVYRDLIRMAIKTPRLFVKRVEEDMKRLGFDIGILDKKMPLAGLDKHNISVQKKRALAIAVEYAKYLTLYAYMHDMKTPAIGDILMKADERFGQNGSIQKPFHFSEDKALADAIGTMANDEHIEHLHLLFHDFEMDPMLFIRITKRLASEGDTTLGAQLMKAKNKYDPDDASVPPGLIKQRNKAVFDRDQESGTIANLQYLASLYLPGGFRHTYRHSQGDISKSTIPPIGSFTDRLMLLAFAAATGTDLREECKKRGIPEELVYIAAEEFTVGPNFKLMQVPALGNEIMPVALNPGDVKRLALAFQTLTYFHYQSDTRSGAETLAQDLLSILNVNENILETFKGRDDYNALSLFNEKSPLLAHILKKMTPRMMRVTETELQHLIEMYPKDILFTQAKLYPASKKEGTYVLAKNANGTGRSPQPYLEVLDRKMRGNPPKPVGNPFSLTKRFHDAEQALNRPLYHAIIMSEEEKRELEEVIRSTPLKYREQTKLALRLWMMDLPLAGGGIAHTDLMLDELKLDAEKGGKNLESKKMMQHLKNAQKQVLQAA